MKSDNSPRHAIRKYNLTEFSSIFCRKMVWNQAYGLIRIKKRAVGQCLEAIVWWACQQNVKFRKSPIKLLKAENWSL